MNIIHKIHRDQEGTISIVAVFAFLLLAMLLGMVMNAGRQADGKMRMQNSADAAAYSGGVILTRAMNSLAFTNHLLCETFAMTAIMREARDRNAAGKVPAIAAAWNTEAGEFASAPKALDKFANLQSAIPEKVQLEQQMVDAYSNWVGELSNVTLPVFEMILAQELIPKYQRAAAAIFPEISQMAANEIARRNGQPDFGRGPMVGAMWRTDGLAVGADEIFSPSLPVIDPQAAVDADYRDRARQQRDNLANYYLNAWNNQNMAGFDRVATLTQFGQLWRSYTCGQLQKLLNEEYPDTNLVYQIDRDAAEPAFQDRFMFVGVVYWRKLPRMLPGLFRDPIESDAQAFAQVRVFVPAPRLKWVKVGGGGGANSGTSLGGVPGHSAIMPPDDPGTTGGGGPGRWVVGVESIPTNWDLLNQHWTCQIVPATGPNVPTILSSAPPLPDFAAANLQLPNLGALDDRTVNNVSPH